MCREGRPGEVSNILNAAGKTVQHHVLAAKHIAIADSPVSTSSLVGDALK